MSQEREYLHLELPGFDTQIVVSNKKFYRVNSVQLRNASPLFDSLLDPSKGAHLIVLQNYDLYSGEAVTPEFRSLECDADCQGTDHYSIMYEDEDDDVRKSMYDDYHRIICSIFGREISLKTASIVSLLRDSIGMVQVAEYLGSVNIIAKTIDYALLSQGQILFRTIAASPLEWLDLSYRIKSKVIFKESLIHATGQYNSLLKQAPSKDSLEEHPHTPSILDTMDPILRRLLDRKAKRMKSVCMTKETEVISYYPPNLQRTSTTGRADRDDIGRHSYQKDIFAWQALGCYRHWVAQQMANNLNHNELDGGYEFYTKLAKGGQAYLNREEVASFHNLFPMSAKGMSVLEANLNTIKSAVSEIIKPLLSNKAQLDNKADIKWLTCLVINDEKDFIWEPRQKKPEQKEPRQQGKKRRIGAVEPEDAEGF